MKKTAEILCAFLDIGGVFRHQQSRPRRQRGSPAWIAQDHCTQQWPILGASILGERAGETITQITVAMCYGLKGEEIPRLCRGGSRSLTFTGVSL